GCDAQAARGGRAAAHAARRRHARRRRDGARPGRICGRVSRPEGVRGSRSVPARLLRGGTRRRAVRSPGRGRAAAGAPAGAGRRGLGPAGGAVHVLAATDPANPYGAALPWPERGALDAGHRPGRKAGAAVVLVDGRLVLYVERGGRTLLSYSDEERVVEPAA